MKHIKLFENFLIEGKVVKIYKKPTSNVIEQILNSIENRDGGYNKKFPDVDPKVIKIMIKCWEDRRENQIRTEINKFYNEIH